MSVTVSYIVEAPNLVQRMKDVMSINTMLNKVNSIDKHRSYEANLLCDDNSVQTDVQVS